MPFYAAGHTFEDTPNGIRCVATLPDGTICAAPWRIVCTAEQADVDNNVSGFSHVGGLTQSELASIETRRDKEKNEVWDAIMYAASSGSR